jgi:hypothetical protein
MFQKEAPPEVTAAGVDRSHLSQTRLSIRCWTSDISGTISQIMVGPVMVQTSQGKTEQTS